MHSTIGEAKSWQLHARKGNRGSKCGRRSGSWREEVGMDKGKDKEGRGEELVGKGVTIHVFD